jgi:hypothetical protein
MSIQFDIEVTRHSYRRATFPLEIASYYTDPERAEEVAIESALTEAANTDYTQYSEEGVRYEPEVVRRQEVREHTEVTDEKLNLTVSRYEDSLINSIAKRAQTLGDMGLLPVASVLQWDMDITACHANGCQLKLAELRDASDEEFVHDVNGIRRAINRNTGKLEGIFHPRFALEQFTKHHK